MTQPRSSRVALPRSAGIAVMIALTGCGHGSSGSSAAPVDPSAALFDPTHVVQVSIVMPAADWDALRTQARSLSDIFGGACLSAPFPSPFTYFPATVTIDGQTLGNVGVRKKGFLGSLDEIKPSLKLKFNEYVPGVEFVGLEKMTLNNSKQDPSYIRQSLAYQTFTQAGVPAPRCNFAHVTVNGTDMGLYVHVESMDQKFLHRRFADDRGNLYEGTLSDFRTEWINTFDKKTNKSDPDRSDLSAVVTALGATDATVLDALAPLVDLEEFLTFWAAEVLIAHWDGYTNNNNNFLIYHDPSGGRFKFIPWGTDGVLERNFLPGAAQQPVSVFAHAALPRRLYLLPSMQQRYLDRLRLLLDTAWNEAGLLAEVDRMEALITPIADPGNTGALSTAIEKVRDFIRTQRGQITTELAAGPPAWRQPLPDPPCFDVVGDVSGTFSTTYGTVGAPDPFATGTGTLAGTVDGNPLSVTLVGATAGDNTDPSAPGAQISVVAAMADGTFDVLVLVVDATLFTTGRTVPIDWGSAFGALLNYDPATSVATVLGYIFNGAVHFDAAGTGTGDPVMGSFQGQLVRFGN